METKGVASVRSPVRNLQQYEPSVTHEHFVRAVVESFQDEYAINEPVHSHFLRSCAADSDAPSVRFAL